jgi:deoxycytidylate deaminase
MNPHDRWLDGAAALAECSECLRARCGAVVVVDGEIVGTGWNGPARGAPRLCLAAAPSLAHSKSDRTCCVHAEWRAITPRGAGGTLYFTRVDSGGNRLKSGAPYCTVCSRLALEHGIRFWVLEHETGIRVYDALEYHELSLQEPAP